MARQNRIGASQTIPFRFKSDLAVQIVAVFSGLVSKTIYERFSYPSRGDSSEPWTDLDVDSSGGQYFTGVLSEDATQQVTEDEEDVLILDIKAWDADGNTCVRRYTFPALVYTEVTNVEPLPDNP